MPITMEELDGKYEVRSETSDGGPYILNGDGTTEIKNGLTYRKDKNGFIWESSFSIAGDAVQMESTLDPSHSKDPANYIKDEKGNPTKSMMTYHSVMEVKRDGGKLVMVGEISHGGIVTRLTMTKLSSIITY